MKIQLAFLLSLSFSFWFFFIPFSPVLATGEFISRHEVSYSFQNDGRAAVNNRITITNKASHLYVSKYTFGFYSAKVENVRVFDENGPLKFELQQKDNFNQVEVEFSQPTVGLGKSFVFNIDYDDFDLAQKNGEVWELFLPKLGDSSDISDYQVNLAIPKSFGYPAYISPEPDTKSENGESYIYTFSMAKIKYSGITAAFGDFQIFDFTLIFHLENTAGMPGTAKIALPPDTAFQTVEYKRIDPSPQQVIADPDGNWLAEYYLNPGEKVNVVAGGFAKIYASPKNSFSNTSAENLSENLLPQKYWEVDRPEIKKKAEELKTPLAIYNFVSRHLNYDISLINEPMGRQGAYYALNNPERAICTEFTDLFIALARAAGIPAREVNGYAYTTDIKTKPLSLISDVLHAWPEYWDDQRRLWVPVDPTWGNTTGGIDYFSKIDLNHFGFVVHGRSSVYPYPAGSYRTEGSLDKDVQINFGRLEPESIPKLEAEFQMADFLIPGTRKEGRLFIRNKSGHAAYNQEVYLNINGVRLIRPEKATLTIDIMPPYSFQSFPLEIASDHFFDFHLAKIVVSVNNKNFDFSVSVGYPPKFYLSVFIIFGILVVITGFFVIKRIKDDQKTFAKIFDKRH